MQERLQSIISKFDRKTLQGDIVAGLTGAVAGAPQAMGFALIAGLNPVYGLYTAFVATIIGALTGSSTFMTVGPTNALSLVTFSVLSAYTGDAQIERLFVLTLLTGVFMLLFGVLRLGSLVRFVSNAVMTGFITGAGLLIMLGQLSHMTGYHAVVPAWWPQAWSDLGLTNSVPTVIDWFLNIPQSHPQTAIVGFGCAAIIVLVHHTRFKNYAVLLAILAGTVVVMLFGWNGVDLVRDISAVPRGLPAPVLPDLAFVPELTLAAFAIAVLGSVQSAAIIGSVPEPDGSHADLTRDFMGMGWSNIVGAVFQGMPACGSLSRTAVNISAGGRTKLANLSAGVFVGLILLLLGAVVDVITLAALAAHLVVAAASLIRPAHLHFIWKVNWSARLAMIVTFIATLILPLEYSIYVGVILSLLLYVYTSSQNVTIERIEPLPDGGFKRVEIPQTLPSNAVTLIGVHGHLYFAAVRALETALPNPTQSHNSYVVLRLRGGDYIGSTGMNFMLSYNEKLRAKGGGLLLSGVSKQVYRELKQTGTLDEFGKDNIFTAGDVYFASTRAALERAEARLAESGQHNDDQIVSA